MTTRRSRHSCIRCSTTITSSTVRCSAASFAFDSQPHKRHARQERHPPPAARRSIAYFAGVAGTFTRATSRAQLEAALHRARRPADHAVQLPPGRRELDRIGRSDAPAWSRTRSNGRAMPAVGVEYEWPILATLGSSVHTFGPKAQLIAPARRMASRRPPERGFAEPGVRRHQPFRAGTSSPATTARKAARAPISASSIRGFSPSGATIDALFGRSYPARGRELVRAADHALTGVGSGLETDDSDYVARVALNTGYGLALTARARFDDDDFSVNSSRVSAVGTYGGSVASLGYDYVRESPASGIFEPPRRNQRPPLRSRSPTTGRSLGSLIYDLHNDSLVSQSLGLAYLDECFDDIGRLFGDDRPLFGSRLGSPDLRPHQPADVGGGGFDSQLDEDRR